MARKIEQADFEVAQVLLQARRADADIIAALVYRGLDRTSAAHVLRSLKSGKTETSAQPPAVLASLPARAMLDRKHAGTDAGAPRVRATRDRTRNLAVEAAAAIILLLLLQFHPWPHYQLAWFRDNEAAYSRFVERHPDSKWAKAANERLRELREEPVWTAALNSGELEPLRDYLKTYPDGKHLAEARAAIEKLAQSQWLTVSLSSSEEEIRDFLREFAGTKVVPEAKRRFQEVQEQEAWLTVLKSGQLSRVRDYIAQNPGSRFLRDAQAEVDRLSLERWNAVASSESEEQLRAFSREFAGTPVAELAERRIAELYYDLNWLAKRNTIAAYQRHLELYPNSPYRAEVEKRIIDLEVAAILASNPGQLPPSVLLGPANSSMTLAEVNVQNDTGYELTVRYSGTESRKLVLPRNGKQTVRLPPGRYTVTASADKARDVQSYAGTKTLEAGRYEDQYYVRSGLGLPNLPPMLEPLPRSNLDDLLRRVR
ncbi:MAG: hypothetical protein KJ070_08930 [Verrucomicrobia bacterium]|nr:hypothetical protein [Verrucomicrobiota bacterium]